MLRTALLNACLILFAGVSPGAARADMIYATSVINYSSQFSPGAWSAAQALGAPDTFAYGDIGTAWAPLPRNGSLEYITVGFATPLYADGFTVRETYGNGFVYQVDALDANNVLHTIWSGTDPSLPGTPVDFSVNFARTTYHVIGLKVYTDTNHDLNAWEEIDAIQLRGDPNIPGVSVPEPSSLALGVLGGLGLLGYRCRKRQAAAP